MPNDRLTAEDRAIADRLPIMAVIHYQRADAIDADTMAVFTQHFAETIAEAGRAIAATARDIVVLDGAGLEAEADARVERFHRTLDCLTSAVLQ